MGPAQTLAPPSAYDSRVLEDDVTIWQGDSRELLARVPDQSVDLICTDPPYNLGGYSTGNIKMSWRSDFNNDVAAWDQIEFDPAEWLAEFRRVLKPTGTIFAFTSYNMLGRWHETFDPVFDTFQFIVWHKTNPPPKLRRVGFLNSCESGTPCTRPRSRYGCFAAWLSWQARPATWSSTRSWASARRVLPRWSSGGDSSGSRSTRATSTRHDGVSRRASSRT